MTLVFDVSFRSHYCRMVYKVQPLLHPLVVPLSSNHHQAVRTELLLTSTSRFLLPLRSVRVSMLPGFRLSSRRRDKQVFGGAPPLPFWSIRRPLMEVAQLSLRRGKGNQSLRTDYIRRHRGRKSPTPTRRDKRLEQCRAKSGTSVLAQRVCIDSHHLSTSRVCTVLIV